MHPVESNGILVDRGYAQVIGVLACWELRARVDIEDLPGRKPHNSCYEYLKNTTKKFVISDCQTEFRQQSAMCQGQKDVF